MRKYMLLNVLRENKVIIFGAGKQGKLINKILKQYSIDTEYFCDNDVRKQNTVIDDVRCISYEDLKNDTNVLVIVSMAKESDEVYKQLISDGFKKLLEYSDIDRCFRNEVINYQDYDYLKVNRKFENIHKGKRCFILGSGPSINNQDLSLLKNEITFTVNFANKIKQFSDINTNYHVFADPAIFKIEDSELISDIRNISGYSSKVECFMPYNQETISFSKRVFEKINNVSVNYFEMYDYDDLISCDLTKPINVLDTVVQYAILLAIYMGFNEIYILGCECTDIVGLIKAYEQEKVKESNYAYSMSESYKNFLKGIANKEGFEAAFRSRMLCFKYYKKLAQYCEENGIIFRNCTEGGILDCVQRAKYEDIIINKKVD